MTNNKIDIRHFIEKGYQYGMIMEGTFSVNGNDKAMCVINSDFITMTYHHKKDGFLKYMKQEIPLEWESRNYGSKDAFFRCPCCGKKTLVLYHRGTSLLCRGCRMLTRQSICKQYEFSPSNGQ